MKRIAILFVVPALLLAGCRTAEDRLTYDVALNAEDAGRRLELLQQLENVTMRKIGARGYALPVTVSPRGDGGTLTISGIEYEEVRQDMEQILSEDFSFRLLFKLPPEEGDVEPQWEPTGIDGARLEWILVTMSEEGAGAELLFDDEGKTLFANLIEERNGETVGMFVRDLLISELAIDAQSPTDRILISGIPSVEMAQVFAEDVNVGLHVRLIPR